MRVLLALTYYRPYISGLTIYVERLGRALAERGHEVTVLTSQYSSKLPLDEHIDGINVIRVPVAMRVSKGVIMPMLGYWATRLVAGKRCAQRPSAPARRRGNRAARPPVQQAHDPHLSLRSPAPAGPFNRAVDKVSTARITPPHD